MKTYGNDKILRFERVELQVSIFEYIQHHQFCYRVELAWIEINGFYYDELALLSRYYRPIEFKHKRANPKLCVIFSVPDLE